jgi:DNA-binding transcriptional ArsR family regulator
MSEEIRDADTDPKIWLFAITDFDPRAAAKCYPLVFMYILNEATKLHPDFTVGPVGAVMQIVKDHVGAHKLEGAVEFLSAEIANQLLCRIHERYPYEKGYSAMHIAMMTLARGIQEAHDAQAEDAALSAGELTETSERVLRALAAMTGEMMVDYYPADQLAQQLGLTVEEIRRHLRVLAEHGLVEKLPEN